MAWRRSSWELVMSVIAAMWSQSMPWRKPNQNAATRRPSRNPAGEKAPKRDIVAAIQPDSRNDLQLRPTATSGGSWGRGLARPPDLRPLAPGAEPGDGEVGQVRPEAVVAHDQLLEASGFVHRERVLGPAPRACQVDVLAVGSPVVLRAGFQVGMGEHPEVLEDPQGPVDRGGVHARHPLLDPPGDRGGADVPLGGHDLGDDRSPLGRHPESPGPQELEHRICRCRHGGSQCTARLAGAQSCGCDEVTYWAMSPWPAPWPVGRFIMRSISGPPVRRNRTTRTAATTTNRKFSAE